MAVPRDCTHKSSEIICKRHWGSHDTSAWIQTLSENYTVPGFTFGSAVLTTRFTLVPVRYPFVLPTESDEGRLFWGCFGGGRGGQCSIPAVPYYWDTTRTSSKALNMLSSSESDGKKGRRSKDPSRGGGMLRPIWSVGFPDGFWRPNGFYDSRR